MDQYLKTEIKKIISKFQNNPDLELEFHFSFKNLEKILFEKIFNNLNNNKNIYNIDQQVNIIYEDIENKFNNYRLTKQFKDGVNLNNDIIVLKKSMNKALNIKSNIENILNLSLHLNKEKLLNNVPFNSKIKLIIIKLRISFIIKDLPEWRYDLDLLKEIQIDNNNLKEYKDKILFPINIDNYLNNIPYNYIDKSSLEIEYIGDKTKLNEKNINEPIDYLYKIITPNYGEKIKYQEYIYLIAQFIISNKYLLNQFKVKSGFKRLSNNVIELNSNLYYSDIIPYVNNYYITDKIDGQRCMLYISEDNNNNININLISDKLYTIKSNDFSSEINNNKPIIILDAEFLYNGVIKDNELDIKNLDIYVFDVILFDKINLSKEPFEKRISYFNDIDKFLNKYKLGRVKVFIKLTDNYRDEIKKFYKESLKQKYEIDGLIFTPNSNVINTSKTNKNINKDYINMVSYKWKPENKITIDFYIAKSTNKNKKDYILCNGINEKDYEKLNIQLIDNYYKIIPYKYSKKQYFPIPFTPSISPLIYKYTHNNDENLNGKIGEFLYNKKNNSWELQRIRIDRDIEVERGEYFGNAFKYAELILMNILHPLSINDLTKETIEYGYFSSKSEDKYKAQRNFNSFVKTKILESILNENLIDKNNKKWIIDLASGKGQDLARINDLGFENGLFVDIDFNALLSLVERKYDLRLRTSNRMNIYIKEVDLSLSYSKIIKLFHDIPINTADVIICNFAIHYLTNTEKNIKNILSLVSNLLSDNGRFIFTCFNGEKVFNLLNKDKQWDIMENNELKYSIKKEYKSDNFENYGQKIGVLLPFSNKEYYNEYLVNLEYLFNIAEKNELILEISHSFETLLNKFQDENKIIYNSLTNDDKTFVSLYQYNILKKTKKKFSNNLTDILGINIKEIYGKSAINIILPLNFSEKSKISDNIIFIIPIRETDKNDQEDKLSKIISNIDYYIKDYNINYKICIIEQTYSNIFNKKKLYNIGFDINKQKFPKNNNYIFIDLKTTDDNSIKNDIKYYIKNCNNPILINKNYIFQKNKFDIINGFSNYNKYKVIDRLNYYKIPLITSNIDIIISNKINYNDNFKEDGINSINYDLLEVIIKNNIHRYIVDF